jgi:PTS system N-acetylgalactosamine-specific IIA component
MSESGPAAIVLAHGDIATALVDAVQLISGRGDRLLPLSNRGLGAPEIEALLREHVEATGARVVFTDLPAGSCSFAACRILRDHPEVTVVGGVNLPALLHFATHEELPPEEAAAMGVDRGAAALRLLPGAPRGH